MNIQDQELQELMFLHEQMLYWAQEGNWTQVAATEEIHRNRIQQFFQHPIGEERAEQVRSSVKIMLETNSRIMDLVQKGRGDMEQEISSIRKGRRALAAYGENTQRSGKGMSEKS
ncbi:flagellar protein FliT [Thiolapillus sp.]